VTVAPALGSQRGHPPWLHGDRRRPRRESGPLAQESSGPAGLTVLAGLDQSLVRQFQRAGCPTTASISS